MSVIEECPSRSLTTFGFSFAASSSVAQIVEAQSLRQPGAFQYRLEMLTDKANFSVLAVCQRSRTRHNPTIQGIITCAVKANYNIR